MSREYMPDECKNCGKSFWSTSGFSFCDSCTLPVITPTKAPRDEHDQPLPKPVGGPNMQDLVMKDMKKRLEVGIQRYGQGLKGFDGRDALADLYDELMDACVYIRKVMYERDGK